VRVALCSSLLQKSITAVLDPVPAGKQRTLLS
jgi:hypothetical protein